MLGTKANSLTEILPLVLGHEFGGRVIATGKDVPQLRYSDKVVVLPHWTCGACRFCKMQRTNLCENLKHAGCDYNGGFSKYGIFPANTLYHVDGMFADALLPLVEPLSCILLGIMRIAKSLRELAQKTTPHAAVFGGGPMGVLLALALKRFYPQVYITIIEPHPVRRNALRRMGMGDSLLEGAEGMADVSLVATSAVSGTADAIAHTVPEGTVLLFAGLNVSDIGNHPEAHAWEYIHRNELHAFPGESAAQGRYLCGTTGYTHETVKLAVEELVHNGSYWRIVQNVTIDGLSSHEAWCRDGERYTKKIFQKPAAEAYLSPQGIYDKIYGADIASSIKVLIRP